MNFEKAMKCLKNGMKVRCRNWYDEDTYCEIVDGEIEFSNGYEDFSINNLKDLENIFCEWDIYTSEEDVMKNSMKFEILAHCVKIEESSNESNCKLYKKGMCNSGCFCFDSVKNNVLSDEYTKSALENICEIIKENDYE